MTAKLFEPYKIRDLTLKNRITMSPMCMYSCPEEDGKVNDWHLTHYTTRAVGQVGLVILEASAITEQGRISPQDLGIWSDEQIPGLNKLVDLNHKHHSKIGIQIGHAGRKAVVDGPIIAPSAEPFNEKMKTPEEMNNVQIEETIEAFKQAARRAKEAGFDVIELHGAHGYLISEFLSPLANKRTDEYGGSRDNRYRFLEEVINAVKQEWDGVLFVRVSASDFREDGNSPDDHVYFAKKMKAQGVDLIDCSAGGVAPAKINPYPGYQVPFADQIRNEAEIPTGAVGLITEPLQAEEILQNGRGDLVVLARELLRDPYWPLTAARALGEDIEAPRQYRRGWDA
ncbi:MAG TPA: NADPH dehydrogenase NamA [Bacillales bacterium]|nr:NADPH dehydrogenase NamA [Bacillales bacterium]